MARGDGPDDFDAFFRREYRALVGLAVVLTGNPTAAEDLAQDALLAAHRKWTQLANFDDPGAWVRRVVANRSASTWRRRGRELRALTRLGHRATESIPPIDPPGDEFWLAVRALPTRQVKCIALHYLEDRSVAEVAEILAIAPGTVRVHLHAARGALARRLGETEDDDS